MTKKERRYNGLKTLYSINGLGKSGQIHAKKNETKPLDHFPTPYIITNSK